MNFLRSGTFLLISLLAFSAVLAADHYPFSDQLSDVMLPVFVDKDLDLYIGGELVKKGDRIIFDSNEFVYFEKTLGQGGNTTIFEDSFGRAVRIPNEVHDWDTRAAFLRYKDAVLKVNKLGDPTYFVRPYARQPKSKYVFLVENLNIKETLENYVNSENLERKSPKYKKLLAFLKEITRFNTIGDFAPFQVGWVEGRGWVLFDLDEPVILNSEGVSTSLKEIIYEWDPIEHWGFYIEEQKLNFLIEDFNNFIKQSSLICVGILK